MHVAGGRGRGRLPGGAPHLRALAWGPARGPAHARARAGGEPGRVGLRARCGGCPPAPRGLNATAARAQRSATRPVVLPPLTPPSPIGPRSRVRPAAGCCGGGVAVAAACTALAVRALPVQGRSPPAACPLHGPAAAHYKRWQRRCRGQVICGAGVQWGAVQLCSRGVKGAAGGAGARVAGGERRRAAASGSQPRRQRLRRQARNVQHHARRQVT